MHRLVSLLLLGALSGCALLPAPGWIENPPLEEGWIYAVGSAGVTFDKNPATSEDLALQRALDQLARQIRVQVTTHVSLTDTERASQFTSETSQFSEEELEWVQIRKKWVDRSGKLGDRGRVYVLVRMTDANARRTGVART